MYPGKEMIAFLITLSLIVPLCNAQTNPEVHWVTWLVLAIALGIAIVLICLAGFYILHIFKKLSVTSGRATAGRQEQSVHSDKPNNTEKHLELSTMISDVKDHSDLTDTDQLIMNDGLDEHQLNGSNSSTTVQEITRQSIKINQLLGMGKYGPLYDGEVQLNTNVKSRTLIKVFQKGTAQDLVLFKKELECLMKLKHSKVGQLFGIVSNRPFFCLLELPVNGDLKTFLITAKRADINLSAKQLIGLATDVSSGLVYLQSLDYIHRDIATRCCMVTQNLSVKITDYKVGRYLFRNEYGVQADGSLLPIRWMAPETLLENHFSLQSDIWSFGVLLWEIMTLGEFPYCELSDGEVIKGVCYKFQRLLQPVECTEKLYEMMLECWHSNPAQRPSMDDLHQQLETHILQF